MRKNTIQQQDDNIDFEEIIPPTPRQFNSKFFKELNNFQRYIQKEQKKKQKEETVVDMEPILKEDSKSDKLDGKVLQEQIIRNGNRIKGIWKNNQLHGDVTISYDDGAFFEGKYENGVRTYGLFRFTDGHQYQGGFLCDQFNGEGRLRYPNGKTIEGDWTQGTLEGKAKISYQKGDVYYGEVQNYKKNGVGHMFFADGSKYIGEFRDGDITGIGSFYEGDVLKFQGLWEKGQFIKSVEKDIEPLSE